MIYVTRLQTWTAKPLLQLTCATTPSSSQVCIVKRTTSRLVTYKTTPPTNKIEATEYKDNLLICDLWHNGTNSVHNTRVMYYDAKYHLAKTPEKCLQEEDWVKKKMYREACQQQCQHIFSFLTSVYGLLGVEAAVTLKRIASCLVTKGQQPFSRVCGYVKSRIAITLVRATYWCIWGSRVPAHNISMKRLQW